MIFVKRFFGLPVGSAPPAPATANPSDYRYFCPDGTKVVIDATTPPCTWAARPWQGYMTNGGVSNIQAVQDVSDFVDSLEIIIISVAGDAVYKICKYKILILSGNNESGKFG